MRNFSVKVFSLMCALLLFFFLRSNSNSSQLSFSVPVELRNLPPEKVILLPSQVLSQVTIRGPSFLVSQVAASVPVIKLRIPDEPGNNIELALSEDSLGLPPAVEVVRMEPNQVQLVLDNRMTKRVPVRVDRLGGINNNLRVLEKLVTPETIEVSGAETEVKGIAYVETFPLDMREIRGDAAIELDLRMPWKHTKASPARVLVSVKVASVKIERRFEQLPVEVRSRSPKAVALTPTSVTVEVTGPRTVVAALEDGSITPYIRLGEFDQAGIEVEVLVDLPEDVELVALEPERIHIAGIAAAKPKEVESAETGARDPTADGGAEVGEEATAAPSDTAEPTNGDTVPDSAAGDSAAAGTAAADAAADDFGG